MKDWLRRISWYCLADRPNTFGPDALEPSSPFFVRYARICCGADEQSPVACARECAPSATDGETSARQEALSPPTKHTNPITILQTVHTS
eukprot:2523482-Prymnesium_polylepis.2